MAETRHKLRIIIEATDKAGKQIKSVNKQLKETNKQAKVGRGAMLGFGLSMLFSGMALRRFAEGAIRGMWKVYSETMNNTNRLILGVNKLKASFLFFKWAMLDAIESSEALMWIIEMIIKIVDWVSSLDKKWRGLIIVLLLIGAVAGAVMMTVGQAFLFIFGVSMMLMIPFWSFFLIILIIIAVVIALYIIWTSGASLIIKILLSLIVILFGLGLILTIMGFAGAAMFIMWIVIALIVIALLVALFLKYKDQIFAIFKAIWEFIKKVFTEWIPSAIKWLIKMAIKIFKFLFMFSIPGMIYYFVKYLSNKVGFIRDAFQLLGKAIGKIWDWIGNKFKWVWTNVIKPIIDFMIRVARKLGSIFGLGKVSAEISTVTAPAGTAPELKEEEGGFLGGLKDMFTGGFGGLKLGEGMGLGGLAGMGTGNTFNSDQTFTFGDINVEGGEGVDADSLAEKIKEKIGGDMEDRMSPSGR